MSISKQEIAFTSVIAYAAATYVMIAPAFTVNQFRLPDWLAFLIVSIPFLGRIIGSFLYQKVIEFFGSRTTYLISLPSLGLLSLGSSVSPIILLIPLRLAIGIIFGIVTSLAVEQAARSGNRIIMALTMAGWAFGWIGGALSYLAFQQWSLIALSGIITLPFSAFYKNVIPFSSQRTKITLPPIASVMLFFFSFEPSFSLQLAPAIIEDEGGISWLILGYSISIFMYVLAETVASLLGELRTLLIYAIASAASGVSFFLTASPYLLVAFTAFGLGINSISPRIASVYGASARVMGFAMNTAAIGGVIVPVIGSFNVKLFGSLFTAISMTALIVMTMKKSNAITTQI